MELASAEGTTQGCPLGMIMYALATIPIIRHLQKNVSDTVQVWYADDSQACGKIDSLFKWWNILKKVGPDYGYFPRPDKCCLIVKPELLSTAKTVFQDSGIEITSGAKKDLGGTIGSSEAVYEIIKEKIGKWEKDIERLVLISKIKPHAAFAYFVHALRHRWSFLQRVVKCKSEWFEGMEALIRNALIPSFFGAPNMIFL